MTEQIMVSLSKLGNPGGDLISWQMNWSKCFSELNGFVLGIALPFSYVFM